MASRRVPKRQGAEPLKAKVAKAAKVATPAKRKTSPRKAAAAKRSDRRKVVRSASNTLKQGKAKKMAQAPTRVMRIRELDPHAACGQGTTVMQLFRVDDLPTASATSHLVFYDRHGWYCEHGRDCPAVAAVRKHEQHGLRRQKVG